MKNNRLNKQEGEAAHQQLSIQNRCDSPVSASRLAESGSPTFFHETRRDLHAILKSLPASAESFVAATTSVYRETSLELIMERTILATVPLPAERLLGVTIRHSGEDGLHIPQPMK